MKEEQNKYFLVRAKCGHVGKNNYILVDFAVKAENGAKAAEKARNFPRVKHHQKDAILQCIPLSFEEFQILAKKNDLDPYLKCKNIEEQRQNCDLLGRVIPEGPEKIEFDPQERKDRVKYIRRKHKYDERDYMKECEAYYA